MTKKELIKRIEEYKPKYIYQRYAGKINKYEILFDNELLNLETGMHINLDRHAMLGKVSENLINLIEEGDYVNGSKVIEIDNCKGAMRELYLEGQNSEEDCGYYFEQIETVVTKEQFESISFKV